MATSRKSLNVIGLISGGKDSFFSLLHCLENNHKITALANLYPPLPSAHKYQKSSSIPPKSGSPDIARREFSSPLPDDLNSFMYQTAGHTLIPLYAEALGLPLYREEIIGTAQDFSKHYRHKHTNSVATNLTDDEVDETESLIPLLKKIMTAHPEANAVCSGAILSTYQRTRIESIATRLGLVPLSYLWQYPILPPPSEDGLLDDMAAVGFDVRIVKVSSGGLDQSFLWSNLMDKLVRRRVEKALGRFGGSVLGEGGEYETLVIDGPPPLWKGRIQVDETLIYRGDEQRLDSAYSLAFAEGGGKAVSKQMRQEIGDFKNTFRKVRLWDREFETLVGSQFEESQESQVGENHERRRPLRSNQGWAPSTKRVAIGSCLYLSNMTNTAAGSTASEQMSGINRDLMAILEENNLSTNNITFTTILLRSLTADFAAVNDVYGRLFTRSNPPARVTVATDLPSGVNVMVSFVIHLGPTEAREGLHVQSRSYWAPANIGPYSQAISIQQQESGSALVYVAGQIPLVPATMEALGQEPEHLLNSGDALDHHLDLNLFHKRACLSLQHLWRIGVEMKVGWWTGGVAFIAGPVRPNLLQTKARIAHQIWKAVHQRSLWEDEQASRKEAEDDDDNANFDIWDQKYLSNHFLAAKIPPKHSLPDFSHLPPQSNSTSPTPGFFAVQVTELPRGCDIEWQSLGVSSTATNFEDTSVNGAKGTTCLIPEISKRVIYLSIDRLEGQKQLLTERIMEIVETAVGRGREGNGLPRAEYFMTVYSPHPSQIAGVAAQLVPCKAVWGDGGVELAAGVVLEVGRRSG